MKKLCKVLLLVVSCFIVTTVLAGEKQQQAMEKITEHIKNKRYQPWTWVFYGDSITHGAVHTFSDRSFVELFHERLRGECGKKSDVVINSGSSGYSSFELLNDQIYERNFNLFNNSLSLISLPAPRIIESSGSLTRLVLKPRALDK